MKNLLLLLINEMNGLSNELLYYDYTANTINFY